MTAQTTQNDAQENDFQPLKITCAPNGARRGLEDHPKLPITIETLIFTAKACADAGADEIHLHIRDNNGRHSLDPVIYQETIAAICDAVPMLGIQVTTEAAGVFGVAEQLATLKVLEPKAASISVREIAREANLVKDVYGFVKEAEVQVQHILYDLADLAQLNAWQDAGIIQRSGCDVLLVLGQYNPPRAAQVADLQPFSEAAKSVSDRWMVCAFGQTEHEIACAAMNSGGHVRIGFENNIHRPNGELATDNTENIARAVNAARSMGRQLVKEVERL